jgi:hypothetical protein
MLLAAPEFQQIDEVDGILIESREVEGSSFNELRLTAVSDSTIDSLCDAAWGDGSIGPGQPEVKSRRVLEEKMDERVIYDQISAPFVSDRDYALRVRRTRTPQGICEVAFDLDNARAPALQDGWVRIEKLRGSWRFEPDFGGKTRVSYVIFTDPGGSVPAFMAKSALQRSGVRCVKAVLEQGRPAEKSATAQALRHP